jgi:hypothetical protein
MNALIAFFGTLKTILRQVTEAGFIFIGFVVLVYLLLGEHSGDFVISVIANISIMINVITPQVLSAVGLGVALLYLVKSR